MQGLGRDGGGYGGPNGYGYAPPTSSGTYTGYSQSGRPLGASVTGAQRLYPPDPYDEHTGYVPQVSHAHA
jgi:hypothetical protein